MSAAMRRASSSVLAVPCKRAAHREARLSTGCTAKHSGAVCDGVGAPTTASKKYSPRSQMSGMSTSSSPEGGSTRPLVMYEAVGVLTMERPQPSTSVDSGTRLRLVPEMSDISRLPTIGLAFWPAVVVVPDRLMLTRRCSSILDVLPTPVTLPPTPVSSPSAMSDRSLAMPRLAPPSSISLTV